MGSVKTGGQCGTSEDRRTGGGADRCSFVNCHCNVCYNSVATSYEMSELIEITEQCAATRFPSVSPSNGFVNSSDRGADAKHLF